MSRPQQLLPALTALLSSSCCVIQLILNFFSISCAGFAVLTPYRSLLGSITIILLSYNLYNKGLNNRQTIVSLVLSMTLMISPEIVKWVNQSTIEAATGTIYSYRIHLDGLGCEACANRIRNTLNSADWVYQARVFFENQTAIVQTLKECSGGKMTVEMVKSIDAKYDAQVIDSWV